MSLSKTQIWIFVGIVILFFAFRLPGLHIPYHQDEYKWPLYSDESVYPPGSVPHPPLTEFIYRIVAPNFGYSNFRVIPLVFSFLNLLLLFYLVRFIFGTRAALWSSFLFAISFYSVLASLMIDVDGAVMPFFLLLSAIGYYKLKASLWKNWKWGGLLLFGLLCGFLVKVIFALPMAVFALDFAIEKKVFSDRKKLLRYGLWILSGIVGLILILLSIKFVFPFFNLGKALKYWQHFAVFSGRGWFQTAIQFTKAILYSSPLLILPAFCTSKEIWNKARPFFLFVFASCIFYLFVFDFSLGALDRYFELLVLPLSIISGAVFAEFLWSSASVKDKKRWVVGYFVLLAVILVCLQFFHHAVPPQYPKTEWIHRALSLKWNFLFPFTGGSGPTGFYMSFVFMAVSWLLAAALLLKKRMFLIGILIIGCVYNLVFVEEYLFGKVNGSAYGLFKEAKAVIIKDPSIQNVIVYNDIGGYEIRQTGKYFRRMYATPQFEEEYKGILGNFSGHILYIDIPRIQEGSFYTKYFDTCTLIHSDTNRTITEKLFDCRKK